MKDLTLYSPVNAIPGIGKTRAEAFARLGVFCVRDLLYHFPRAYENRGDIRAVSAATDGLVHALSLVVATEPKTARLHRGMTVTKFRALTKAEPSRSSSSTRHMPSIFSPWERNSAFTES